ncbi:hypothetical protein ABZW11_26515 [Nonomuraea sp. NPDC004580]|uniref:hypothetical protein n=1 Tax=Nonomuraea sp. NPDC004580 TaxID=3154552 RepID=UPI0033AB025B
MAEIEVTTWDGDTWTVTIAEPTHCDTDAIHRAATDYGLRARLITILWSAHRPTPTSEASIGGYVWEIADRLATALEGDLLACPPAWECVCGTINHGQWSSRETCKGCRTEIAKPTQVAAHYRLVPPPAENGVLARMLEAARARRDDGMVVVRRADLDLVMNGAGDATRMTNWADACQRIRDALEGGRHG